MPLAGCATPGVPVEPVAAATSPIVQYFMWGRFAAYEELFALPDLVHRPGGPIGLGQLSLLAVLEHGSDFHDTQSV